MIGGIPPDLVISQAKRPEVRGREHPRKEIRFGGSEGRAGMRVAIDFVNVQVPFKETSTKIDYFCGGTPWI
jgi:hypothetical protein